MVAKGIRDMHSKDVLHRDIKSYNIAVKRNGEIKLIDLGNSKLLSQQSYAKTQGVTTKLWRSPEMLSGTDSPYSNKVDIWALGIFIHELAKGKPPFFDLRNKIREFYEAIENTEVEPI